MQRYKMQIIIFSRYAFVVTVLLSQLKIIKLTITNNIELNITEPMFTI